MKRLQDWLEKEPTGSQIFVFAFLTFIAGIAYGILAVMIFHLFGIEVPSPTGGNIQITTRMLTILFFWLFFEEIAFRLPLYLVRKHTKNFTIILVAAIIFSALFGLVHGHWTHTFVQGGIGFIYALAFLKCGGLKGKGLKPLAIVILIHEMHDFFLIFLVMVSGGTTFHVLI